MNDPDKMMEQLELEKSLKKIKHNIVVLSGKGGVGKSTIAANMALTLAGSGYNVGLLDVDFHGPTIPKLLGLEGSKPGQDGNKLIPVDYASNLKVISLGMLVNSDDAVIWRGPMKMGALQQLLRDVNWGELDYLIFDCPPGTGDEPLSIVQLIPKATGAVVVTTPQAVSTADVRRSIKFCHKVNLPVIGVIENMSGYKNPESGEMLNLFGHGGGERMAAEMNETFLGRIPIDPKIVELSDSGQPFVVHAPKSETNQTFVKIMEEMLKRIEELEKS